MKKLSVIILASILSFTTFSCGDDDSGGPMEETLTGGAWKLVSSTLNGNDVTTKLDECDLKDTYLFNEDNTLVFTSNKKEEGTGSCSSKNSSGTWKADSSVPNSIRFIAAFDGDDIDDKGKQLNFRIEDQTLVEIVKEPVSSGGFDSFRYSYKKQ